MKPLASDLIDRMPNLTAIKSTDLALKNTRVNLPFIEQSIGDLSLNSREGNTHTALVIGAGPSLHRNNPVSLILDHGFDGTVVCADGALPYCLRNGLVPDYVVTLDPHPTRIVRWFGDPDLNSDSIAKDDYFRRQDLDPEFMSEELSKNAEVMELVDQNAPNINAIIATCVSEQVTKRCMQAGFKLFWWNPLYDDVSDPNSMTRKAYNMNKVPCMGTGGNTGSSAWVFANVILQAKHIAMVGMDLSYAPGTELVNTQYYTELKDLYGAQVSDAYVNVFNPHANETWLTDPTYYWYRETLIDMAKNADCTTYNCTEGGIVFGPGIEYISLKLFLETQDVRKGCN